MTQTQQNLVVAQLLQARRSTETHLEVCLDHFALSTVQERPEIETVIYLPLSFLNIFAKEN